MNFLRRYWFIFLLPAIVIALSFWLKSALGPFWQYADDSYIYLLNSVNLVKGLPSVLCTQPGVPVQVLGQLVILMFNMGHTMTETVRQVLLNPEYYLNAINAVLLLLIALTSVLLGHYVYRKTGDVVAVLLSQLPNVFLLTLRLKLNDHPCAFDNVNAQPMLIAVTNIFNLFLLKLHFSKDNKDKNFTVFILSFICGFGIATKLTFLPLLGLILLFARWPMKPVAVVVTAASFMLWTIPILSSYRLLWAWLFALLTHTGHYGNGNAGFIDIKEYMATWAYIFHNYWFFVLLPAAFLLFPRSSFFVRAVSLMVLLQFVLIAKHFDDHYLVIAVDSLAPALVLFYLERVAGKKVFRTAALLLIIVSVIVCSIITLQYSSRIAALTREVVGFSEMIHAKYPHSIYIGSYLRLPLSTPEYALFMGNDSSGGAENQELSKLYPDYYAFFTEGKDDVPGTCSWGLWHFDRRVFADDLLKQYPHRRIIFINSGYGFDQTPYITRPLEDGRYSHAYLLVGSQENAADSLFDMAIDAAQRSQYSQAFAFALKSYQLHYQPEGKIKYLLSILYPYVRH
ncbi:MAG: hypothetical protein KGK03_06520 [Candidatus Omnitrophica bacterium]|nr:hypothetical protein [Candidatus Omnitrophota bacterium]MDE2222706.1 hypothetical protein [Candidatus Omnitrophota bacterium]